MKIYFAGSIKGGREYQREFVDIIKELKKYGNVLSEHIGSDTLSHHGETHILSKDILQRELRKIDESDIIFAEVSTPSLGVGYLLGYASLKKKTIIGLYKSTTVLHLSAIIQGDTQIQVLLYKDTTHISTLLEKIFLKHNS